MVLIRIRNPKQDRDGAYITHFFYLVFCTVIIQSNGMILFTSTLALKHFLYLDRNIWGYLFEFDHKYQKNKSVTTYSRRILDLDPVALTLSGSAFLARS